MVFLSGDMLDNRKLPFFFFFIGLTLSVAVLLIAPPQSTAKFSVNQKTRHKFQKEIIDYHRHLNPRFKKIKRPRTELIIVHTSECNLKSTLRTVSQGKQLANGHRTYGGHTHYVIARNGKTYRILNKRYRADHAGRSMWNGATDLSNISIGIELVG